MKACITTFQSAYNYGAVLQAFALQEYLNTNFGETTILDYHNNKLDASYENPKLIDFIYNPKNALFKTMQGILYKGKNKKIDEFRKKYFKLTSRYDGNNINEANKEADIFITGSDQVWNYLIIDKDKTYYLDFARGKRTCSYAASFGIGFIPEEYHEFYKKNINHIQHISVRETKGVELVKDLINKKAEIMPDPTLLLEQKIWDKLSVLPQKYKKYILVYKITKADKLLSFAENISKLTGLPIVYIPNDLKSGVIGKLETNVGTEEWLGYIKNAEYVITNSFHGTVFSILFNKKFFSEVSSKVNPSTSRLLSLLEMFNFENRTIDKYSDEMLKEELDKKRINEVLQEQRNNAFRFFNNVFQDEV